MIIRLLGANLTASASESRLIPLLSCPSSSCCPDVWQCLADLCNVLARVDHEEVPLYKVDTEESEGDEELTVLQLKEDRLLAGFVPLLAAPQEPCYIDRHTDTVRGTAEDMSRHLCLGCFVVTQQQSSSKLQCLLSSHRR